MRVQLDRQDLAKYPFLKEAQDWVAERTGTLDQFLATSYGKIAARNGARRLTGTLRGEERPGGEGRLDPEREIFAYALARILVSCARDRVLIDRLTRFEAARAWAFLQEEDDAKRAYIARSIGIDPDSRALPVIEYVELVPHLREDRWRLVNRAVSGGMVQIGEDELEELIRERIRHILQVQLPLPVPGEICQILSPLVTEIAAAHRETLMREFGRVEEGAFPSCIQALVRAIAAGTNLPHAGRFALTAFLHNIGMSGDQIVEIFARAPDFDLEKTRYQVEHISGRGGTEYTAPSCATLRTTGFCVKRDSLCDRVNHPLSYYRIRKKKEPVTREEKKEEGKEEGEKKESGDRDTVTQSSPGSGGPPRS